MTKTIFTLFRGGNGVGVGAKAAGIVDIGGIEYDADIASVSGVNFPDSPTVIADVREIDPTMLSCGKPTILHASPSCRTASQANSSIEINEDGLKETQEDKEGGLAICRFLECWTPSIFTLENVWGYRNYAAFDSVCDALRRLGYSFDFWHLNAADYGVPQTRRRLILIAKLGRGQRIQKPMPTHHNPTSQKPNQLVMFQSATQPWNSWYEAIEDLIPTLPESEFAPWQLARLPEVLETRLVAQGGYDGKVVGADTDMPAFTVTANSNQSGIRAYVLSNAATQWGDGLRKDDEPVHTITSQGGSKTRAFIVPGGNSSSFSIRYMDEPIRTIGDTKRVGNIPRAFIIGGQFGKPSDGSGETRVPQVKHSEEPIFTVTVVNKGDWRAWLEMGRVVKMTPRCLARFQSFPDSYQLPDNNTLAYRVIGNAVPPLMYEKLVRSLS